MADNKIKFFLELKAQGVEVVKDYKEQIEKTAIAAQSLTNETDKVADNLQNLANSSNDASGEIKDLNKQLDKTSENAENTAEGFKEITENTETLANSTENLNKDLNKQDKALDKSANSAKKSAKEVNNLSKETNKAEKFMKSFIAIAATAFAFDKIFEYAKVVSESINLISINADKVGVEFNRFKAYGEIADRFGINIEQLSDKFIQLNEFVSEAAQWESGSGFEVLNELNLDAKELAKLDPASQFEKIVEAAQKLPASYRNQLLSALSLDDLIPLINNLDKVNERIERLKNNDLFIDPEGLKALKSNFDDIVQDFNSFSMVTLSELYSNLSAVYNIKPGEKSLLNGENARDLAKSISFVIQSMVILGKTINTIFQVSQLAFSGVVNGLQSVIAKSSETLNEKFLTSKYNELKNSLELQYLNDPITLNIQLNLLKEQYELQLKAIKNITGKDADNLLSILNKDLKEAEDAGESLTNSLRDFNTEIKLPEVKPLEINKGIKETEDTLKSYEEKLKKLAIEIESLKLDIQLDPKNVEKYGEQIQSKLIERYNLLSEATEKFKNDKNLKFTILDVKNAQIESRDAGKIVKEFYEKVKAEKKAAFDLGAKEFTDQISEIELKFELTDSKDFDNTLSELNSVYTLYEDYVELNGTQLDLLQLQAEKLSKIKMLRQLEFSLTAEELKLEDLRLQLLNSQENKLEVISLQRTKAIRDIEREFTNVEQRAEAIDLTNKIFDLEVFKSNLDQVEKELEKLKTDLSNTDYFNLEERSRLESEINSKVAERTELQGKLGQKEKEVNENYIFTVERIRKLNDQLKDSFLDIFSDFAAGTKSATEAFNDFATFFLKKISEMILEQLYLNAIGGIAKATGQNQADVGLGSIFSLFNSMPFFHTGGTVGVTQPLMQVPGITKGDESLAVLRKGEQVLTKNQQFNNSNQAKNNIVENTIILDSDSIAKSALESDSGIQGVIKIIRKNKDQVKNILD